MNYTHIHRYDLQRPVRPGKYEIRMFLSGPWLPVTFTGGVWKFLNGDIIPEGIIVLWRESFDL